MNRKATINVYLIAIICLLSYFEFGALGSIIFRNKIILILSLLCGIWIFFSRGKRWSITYYELSWFLAIFFLVLLRNRYLGTGEFDINVVYYFVLTILIVFMKNNTKWVRYFIEFMYWISLLHAIATIIFAFFPSLFSLYTSNFLAVDYYVEAMVRYSNGTISGLCVNYGVNAGILAIGTGIAVVKFIWPGEEGKRRNFLPIGIRLVGLLFTGKRSPVLLMIVAMGIIYIFIEKGKTNRKVVRIILLVIAAIMAIFIGAMFIPQLQVLIGRVMDVDDWSTLGGRTELYEIAIGMFMNNPIFGMGWNSYKLTSATTIGKLYASQYTRMQTHNIYLQLLSEVGIIGLLVMVGLFLYPLFLVFRRTRKYSLDRFIGFYNQKEKMYFLSSVYIIVFFLLYGMTGNPLYDSYMYFLAIISCGALQSYLFNSNHILSNKKIIRGEEE